MSVNSDSSMIIQPQQKSRCCGGFLDNSFLDHKIERFFCCLDVKHGTTAIAIWQIIYIVFIATRISISPQNYILVCILFLPVINIIAFVKMSRNDSELNRKRFFLTLFICLLIMVALEISNLFLEFFG